jgi:hypothetical protein
MSLTADDINVDHVYSAKRPRTVGLFERLWNDRQVLWIGQSAGDVFVQYDSPALPNGRHYPKVSMGQFLKWAKADVTDQCPSDSWRRDL